MQREAWRAIGGGNHVLLAAPTGSGKTLAAFLAAIDGLVKEAESGALADEVRVVYVSPLKALSNDIQRNLQRPLAEIHARLNAADKTDNETVDKTNDKTVDETDDKTADKIDNKTDDKTAGETTIIRAAVRTGDTTASERARMLKSPPHILVTTPESLYILLTSASGRADVGECRDADY